MFLTFRISIYPVDVKTQKFPKGGKMKNVLVMASALLLSFQAQAGNIILTEVDYNSVASKSTVAADVEKAQGQIGFMLDIADQFTFKIFNDKLVNAGAFDAGQPSDNPEDVIDLGEITGGISTAAACADLDGLNDELVSVAGGIDADTTVTVAARSAVCSIATSGIDKKLRMKIPLQEVALKSGGKALMADYYVEQEVGKEFDRLALCDDTLAAAWSATECDGGLEVGLAHVVLPAAQALGQNSLTVELEATLQGAAAKSSYEGYIVAVVGLEI